MSFILEALKKSENERQRTMGPSLADVQRRQRPSEKPWWAIAIGALLLINLLVLVVVLLRDRSPPIATVPAPITATTASAAVAPSVAPQVTSAPAASPPARSAPARTPTSPAVRSLAEEAAVDMGYDPYGDSSHLAAAAAVPSGPPIVRPIEGPSVTPAGMNSSRVAPREEPAEILPTLRELSASGAQLPELHLDIHVHSRVPAERFVFVNMRKYIEGQTLSEGPTIERITSDGVVLNQRGLRFLLPRQ